MSDLTRFRDHCRRMADKVNQSGETCFLGSDRDLWLMLADEVDTYLDDELEVIAREDGPGLWGNS